MNKIIPSNLQCSKGLYIMQTFYSNVYIKSHMGWKCVPLVVETFGARGRIAGQFFFVELALQYDLQHKVTPVRLPCQIPLMAG